MAVFVLKEKDDEEVVEVTVVTSECYDASGQT